MSERVATPLSDVVGQDALDGAGDWGPLAENADAVVCPGSSDEVVEVVRWAQASGVTVVPIGSGRHVSADRPVGPYVLLSTTRLNGIAIYEPADLTLTAGAGLRVSELLAATSPHDQWLPFDPPDFPGRTLGGLIAAGRSGPMWAGYGDVKNHVLGATVVCGDGRTLRLGGRVVKNVAGFDLLRPMVGSLGGLAIVVSATVRLFPVPALDRMLVLEAPSLAQLVPSARAVATAAVLPVSIVLTNAGSANRLLVRLHGAPETVQADGATLSAAAGVDVEVHDGAEAWSLAESVRDAVRDGVREERRFGLPTELGSLVEWAAERDGATAVIDAYRCEARLIAQDVTGPGGSAGAAQAHLDANAAIVSRLSAGIKHVFDPDGTLWSPRS